MSTVMTTTSRAADSEQPVFNGIIPAPVSYTAVPGETFELTPTTRIVVVSDDAEATAVAERFATWLRRPTGLPLPVGGEASKGDVVLTIAPSDELGAEGYTLWVQSSGVHIVAAAPAGLFRALTTLRQMLPPAVEATDVQPGPWTVPGVEIGDRPRFEYRGTMLDVARHFFSVDDVLRYIDLISLYKINVLHLHLTDDQGWRLTVPGWPRLTEVGGPSDIDGGPGGFYSPADYARIVEYAAERFIEVDPGDRRPRPCVSRPHRLPGVELRRRRAAAVPPRRHLRGVAVRDRPTRPTPSSATCSTPSPPSLVGSSTSVATRRSARLTRTSSSSCREPPSSSSDAVARR